MPLRLDGSNPPADIRKMKGKCCYCEKESNLVTYQELNREKEFKLLVIKEVVICESCRDFLQAFRGF